MADSARGLRNLIIISDLHVNSTLGLCPVGRPIQLDDGGVYRPSKLQRVLWAWWCDFWDYWVPSVTRKEPFGLVINGDIVDGGPHHNQTAFISANREDQTRMAMQLLEPVVARAAKLWVVRGTEAHVGASCCDEETIARLLGAVPDGNGRHARWRLRLRLGFALVDIAHHIGCASSMAYETSAVHRELEQLYADAARYGREPPDVVVRSHRHQCVETRVKIIKRHGGRRYQGFATSCTTPAWQLKTPFSYRVAAARRTAPQIGGTLVRCGDEEVYTRHYVQSLEDCPIEKA